LAEKLKLAVIGCGAVAEKFHLPVATLSDGVEVMTLVDKELARAHRLSERFNIPDITNDHIKIIGRVNAAIIAVPHHLHALIAIDLLAKGIHVLVEKPMAIKVSDCEMMIKAANEAGVVLAIAMQRRFSLTAQFVKQVIDNGLLGTIKSFDLREGNVYAWPVEDKAMLSKEVGGGVVTGIGVHALDLLLWWLGDYDNVEYYDDVMGGIEADCEFHMRLRTGATGVLEFSRTRNLRNTWLIYGERGVLEVGIDVNAKMRLMLKNQDVVLDGHAVKDTITEESVRDLLHRQFDDFLGAIQDHRTPLVSGEEAILAIKLMETGTAHRQPLRLPWISPSYLSYDNISV